MGLKKIVTHVVNLVRHVARDANTPNAARSPEWPKTERAFLKDNPTCAACGGTSHLNVHHKKPFHLDKALELDPTNLITLCMGMGKHCHLLVGHGDDFKAFNPSVETDASKIIVLYKLRSNQKTIDVALAAIKARRQYELKA